MSKNISSLKYLPTVMKWFEECKIDNMSKEQAVQISTKRIKDHQYMLNMDDTEFISIDFNIEKFIIDLADTYDNNLNLDADKFIKFLQTEHFYRISMMDMKNFIKQNKDKLNITDRHLAIYNINKHDIYKSVRKDGENFALKYIDYLKIIKHRIMNRIIKANDADMKFPIKNNNELAKAIINAIRKLHTDIINDSSIDKYNIDIVKYYNSSFLYKLVDKYFDSVTLKERVYLRNNDFDLDIVRQIIYKYIKTYLIKEELDIFIEKEIELINKMHGR